MIIEDITAVDGRTFPARRTTKNLVEGSSSVDTEHFNLGYVEPEPQGGQVSWHNHEQVELYFILAGTLPGAGVDVLPLPDGAWPQCTDAPDETSTSS